MQFTARVITDKNDLACFLRRAITTKPVQNQNSTTVQTLTTCSTFDISKGEWLHSHSFTLEHSAHVAWKTSKGILLMGGHQNPNKTTFISAGPQQAGFNLRQPFRHACIIPNPLTKTAYIIGGYHKEHLTKVIEYSEDGFVRELPNLNSGRYRHACSSYYDEQQNLVRLNV